MKEYIRLTLNQRMQHFVLIISFFLLVATGLPLRYHEAGWAKFLIGLLGGFEMRGTIHRIAGVVMILGFVYHILYVLYIKIAKGARWTLIPNLQDAKDVFLNIGYFLGMRKEPPRFDHYNYIEKAEYWALIWGTVVMAITGLILWFPQIAILFLPNVIFDIATVLHSCEALLAFLAILVWHFYYAHLNPDVFPMNKTWLTGKITAQEMKEHHPLEYERIETEKTVDTLAESLVKSLLCKEEKL